MDQHLLANLSLFLPGVGVLPYVFMSVKVLCSYTNFESFAIFYAYHTSNIFVLSNISICNAHRLLQIFMETKMGNFSWQISWNHDQFSKIWYPRRCWLVQFQFPTQTTTTKDLLHAWFDAFPTHKDVEAEDAREEMDASRTWKFYTIKAEKSSYGPSQVTQIYGLAPLAQGSTSSIHAYLGQGIEITSCTIL